MNVACQAVIVDDVFDELRFVNEIWTQIRPQDREERRTHSVQNTGAVIHGERKRGEEERRRRNRNENVGFEITHHIS
jgi:hypothetical protein